MPCSTLKRLKKWLPLHRLKPTEVVHVEQPQGWWDKSNATTNSPHGPHMLTTLFSHHCKPTQARTLTDTHTHVPKRARCFYV